MPSDFSINKTPKKFQKTYASVLTIIMAAAAILAIAYLYTTSGNILVRFAIAIVVLVVSGNVIATTNGIQNSFGAYLLGGSHGIKLVESLSRNHPKLWIALSDWGLVLGFGFLSYFLFNKYVNKKTILFGVFTILLLMLLAFPYLPIILSFINIPQITARLPAGAGVPASNGIQYITSFLTNGTPLFYLLVVCALIGGFSLFTIALIIYSGGIILYSTFTFLVGLLTSAPNYSILTQQVPGVAPLIPGITIPLFAGLISLFILLVVHEFSHGVLAKIAKVKIKSIGVILFGIIPMGAFVEPDEKQISKLKESDQNRISIAGVSANMLTCIFFFIISIILIYFVVPNVSTGGVLVAQVFKNYSAYGVIPVNSTILMWNNVPIRNSYDLAKVEAVYVPGTTVSVATNEGTFMLMPNQQGKIGITGEPAQMTATYQTANFLYAIAALSFGLNFFVAIFNLMPIPGFDGWRIYQNKIKNKKLLKALMIVLVVAILLNVLPWFWTLA